jgi:hypothetical protein
MKQHVTILGVLFIVFGALGLLGALLALFLFGGAAAIVGAVAQSEPDAQIAVPILGVVAAALFVFISIMSVPGIVTGIGLLKFKNWARILGLVLSVIKLLNIPIGTVLGVYGLWVLLSPETETLFQEGAGTSGSPKTESSEAEKES